MHDLAALLQHRHLIFTGGDCRRAECRDISGLADGIGKETNGDAGFKILLLDLRLDGGVALQAGHRDQIHVVEAQLGEFRHHGLDKDVRLGRVDAHSQIIQCHLQDVLAHFLRVIGVIGQGLCVRDHNIDLVELAGILQTDTLFQGADIVAHMQAAGRAVARQNDLFHSILHILLNKRSFDISISPVHFAVNQTEAKQKKKRWKNFHRFAGASCLTRTGDTLINSQVL